MADILKVSTPLVERLPNTAARPVVDSAAVPFDLSDVTRVLQTTDPSEILQQNTGFKPKENEAPTILADLLQDPAVTASMIRNITMLQEVFALLPGASSPLTQEIQQLFDTLLLNPDQIAPELLRQEENTTLFKGDLFNMLRDLLSQATTASTGKPELATNIGVLLKALNATISRQDVLDSVAGNLTYLSDSLEASPRLHERLEDLVSALREFQAPVAGEQEAAREAEPVPGQVPEQGRTLLPERSQAFADLKTQIFDVLKDIQNSVLYTPSMEKTIPLIVYNLSRYNDNDDFLPDALRLLLNSMDGDDAKGVLVDKLQAYLDRVLTEGGARGARKAEEDSQVIDTLAKIINKSAKSEDLELVSGERFEKIVHSLLSSPSNFTPLLHFIVPVEYQDMRAFAEMWIDPDAGEAPTPSGGAAQNIHMLMVFDVDGIGRFESELFVQDKRIAMNLLCPPAYMRDFAGIGGAIRSAVASLGYSFETINVDRLERTHSLMEVFTDLPYRRMGIDVKI
ncbi:antitoxin [Ruminococcaceae bacterium OttesenSCG-928-D13]|nr:antitoxin [Ruminococcaceae bacterium OttesenSCG-928-D13]